MHGSQAVCESMICSWNNKIRRWKQGLVASSLRLYNNHAHIIPNCWSSSQINLTAKACMALFGPCVEKLHIKLS